MKYKMQLQVQAGILWVWESADGNKILNLTGLKDLGVGRMAQAGKQQVGFVFASKTAFGCPVRGQWQNCMRDGSPVGFIC